MLKLDGCYYKLRFLADLLIQQKFTVQMRGFGRSGHQTILGAGFIYVG